MIAVSPRLARNAAVIAAAAGLSCLGALTGAPAARAQAYPPGGGPFIVSTTLVIAGGQLTFTATLPFGAPIVVELSLPTLLALPRPSSSAAMHATQPGRQGAERGQTLATLVPDARGHVSGSVTIPKATVPGDHMLKLATTSGRRVLAATPLRVLPSTSASMASARARAGHLARYAVEAPPARPFAKPLLAAGAMSVGAGLGGWVLRRRRPHHDN